jgi:hypothetical protein
MIDRWKQWLASAQPGSSITYATAPNLADKELPESVQAVALLARTAEDGFEYIAQRRHQIVIPHVLGEAWQPNAVSDSKLYKLKA